MAKAQARGGRPALVIASRQSLLPTYLLYQAFAYLGTAAADWQNNKWFIDRADLVNVLAGLPEVDSGQAIMVELQGNPDLEQVEFPVLTLADVRMDVTLVTGT